MPRGEGVQLLFGRQVDRRVVGDDHLQAVRGVVEVLDQARADSTITDCSFGR